LGKVRAAAGRLAAPYGLAKAAAAKREIEIKKVNYQPARTYTKSTNPYKKIKETA
jgi:hypothetical protein